MILFCGFIWGLFQALLAPFFGVKDDEIAT